MPSILQLDSDDTMCHWVFNPKHFSGSTPSCLSLDMKLYFSAGNTADPYKMSVNSKNICKNYPEGIHSLGEIQADKLSQRNKARNKDFDENYVGFITADVSELESIVYEDHFVTVEHAPISDNNMHCNVVLKFPESLSKPKKSKRNLIAVDVNNFFGQDIEKPLKTETP